MLMDKYIKIIKSRMSKERFEHSLGVAKTAEQLAFRHHFDPRKAYLAGILHDYGKTISPKELIKIAEENFLITTDLEKQEPFLLHGTVGAFLLEKEMDIHDPEILEAVQYHTTGKPGLGKLGLIIYIADLIEPNRRMSELDYIRNLVDEHLLRGVLAGMDHILLFLIKNKKAIHYLTIETRNWLLNEINQ